MATWPTSPTWSDINGVNKGNEYAGGDGVTLIEWAELFSEQLPEEYLQITLRLDGAGRRAVLEPKGARYEELLGEVEKDADFGN